MTAPFASAALVVPPSGYAWWYVDAVSDDGSKAVVAIFFIGSVFSPWYRRASESGTAPAEDFVAVNVALYAQGRPVAWVMSEYGRSQLKSRAEAAPAIADSAFTREADGRVRVRIRERSAPVFWSALHAPGTRVEGGIELIPESTPCSPHDFVGSDGKRHHWQVMSPRARVKVNFAHPGFSFEGFGYSDVNRGQGRLENAFSRWSWARFHGEERTHVLYSVRRRDGSADSVVIATEKGGDTPQVASALSDGPEREIGWGMRMPSSFAVAACQGDQLRCLPDPPLDVAPFYARYLGTLVDEKGKTVARGLGEYLDLDLFRSKKVQFLLPFKTRRRA